MYYIGCHGITIGFHRYFTHGSFKAKRPLRIALAVAGSLAVEGPLVRWVADHRKHHKFSDAEGDPHSPWRFGETLPALMKGLWWAHMAWMFDEEQTSQHKYAPDLIRDPAIRWVSRHFIYWTIVSLALPPLVGGLVTMSWWGAFTAFFWGSLVRVGAVAPCHLVDQLDLPRGGQAPLQVARPIGQCVVAGGPVLWASPGTTCIMRIRRPPGMGSLRGQIDSSARLIRWFEKLGWAYDVRWPSASRIEARRERRPRQERAPKRHDGRRGDRRLAQQRRARPTAPGGPPGPYDREGTPRTTAGHRPHSFRRARASRAPRWRRSRRRPGSPSRWSTSTSAARRACTRWSSTVRCAGSSTW